MSAELDIQKKTYIDNIIAVDKIGEESTSVSIAGAKSITEFVDRIFQAVTGKTLKEHNKEIAPKDKTDYQDPESDYGSQTANAEKRKEINRKCEEIIKRIGDNPILLTDEDRATLRQFSGKGGLKEGTVHEYYTPAFIAQGIFNGLAEMGFKEGNFVDPSTGSGAFGDAKPKGMICTGSEIDQTSSNVNQLLHPEDKIHHMAFEDLVNATPDNTFDGCATNIPWGDNIRGKNKHKDADYAQEKSIEKYFIHRIIDKVKYGGLIALCVPPRVVSRKGDWVHFRAGISKKAEFLGAHMLPSGMSRKQGTDTVWHVIVLKKHSKEMYDLISQVPEEKLWEHKVLWNTFINGKWFEKDGKKFIHGKYIPATMTGGRFGNGESERVTTDLTDMQLKRKLAMRFESRIDWAALKIEEPVVPNYTEGDTRYINRIQYQLQNGEWVKVVQSETNETLLDESAFGAKTEQELFANCATLDGALRMSFAQTLKAHEKYGEVGVISGIQKKAMDKANNAPLEYREQIYRYNIIGKMCQSLMTSAIEGKESQLDRDKVKELVASEIQKYGHPYNNKKLLKAGGDSHEFNAFCAAFNEKGEESELLKGEVISAKDRMQYNSNDVTAIVEHLVHREGQMMVELDDLKHLYTGDTEFKSLSDIAHIENIAITPNGLIMPLHKYCSGNINIKIAKLTEGIANTKNKKLQKKFQAQIDLMEQKRKQTPIEDITLSARHKWIDKDLLREFLKAQGAPGIYGYYKDVIYHEGTDFEREDKEWVSDDNAKNGVWLLDERNTSATMDNQLSHVKQYFNFINGQKIKEVSVKGDLPAKEKRKIKAEELKKRQEFVDKMEEEFQAFLESHPKADSIEREYNFKFNNNVPYEYPGGDLGLNDLPDWLVPHDYQNQEVRRLSEEGNGICGYNVGLGKTMTALLLDKYNKKMGRSSKTCIVVPKSVTANWYHEAKAVYGDLSKALFIGVSPEFDKDSNIVQEKIKDDQGNEKFKLDEKSGEKIFQYGDKLKNDSASVIKKKLWSIPTTSADLIVIPMPRFEMIPMKTKTRKEYMDHQVKRKTLGHAKANEFLFGPEGKKLLSEIKDEHNTIAQAEGKKKSKGVNYDAAAANERFEELLSRESKAKSELPYWEDMGFSSCIIDESHTYKNSFNGSTGLTDVEFMPKVVSAAGALTATAKMHYIRKTNNGKGSYCLSATPVTNSPLEIWNSLALCSDNDLLDQYGIHCPDDFLQQFCKYGVAEKTRLSGEVATVQAMIGFTNLGALRGIYGSVANIKDAEDVGLPLPANDSKSEMVELTKEQSSIYAMLQEKAAEAAKKRKTGKIMSIMRKMDAITGDPDLYYHVCTFQFRLEDTVKVEKLIEDLPESVEYVVLEKQEGPDGTFLTKVNSKTGKVEIVVEAVTKYLKKSDIKVTPTNNCLKVVVPSSPASIGVTYERQVSERLKKFEINEQDVSHNIPPKYAKLLENIKNGYEVEIDGTVKSINGKHIIFTEEKSNHNKIARILANGLPIDRKKICIINADTCGSNSKTAAITAGFNSGKHTIAICNKKAEVGLNLQKGTCQMHHLDFRWTPASLTQRDGRGIRQGNDSEFVRSSKYLAAGSADAFKLQILEKKAGWINKLLKGDEETIESDQSGKDDMIMEMLASLSGNAEEFYETERKKREKEIQIKRERKVRGYSNTLNQIQHITRFLNGGDEQEKEVERVKLETWIASDQEKWDKQVEKNATHEAKMASMLETLQSEGSKIKEFQPLSKKESTKIKKIPSKDRTTEQKYKLQADRILKNEWTIESMEKYYGGTINSKKRSLENLDAKFARIKKEKEDLLRMKKGALKKAKPEDLPFDISVLDNPDGILVTQKGVSWELGKTYALEKNEKTLIVKVTEVDLKEQSISVEFLMGNENSTTWKIMDLNTTIAAFNPKPCTMSEDEINLERTLQEGIRYEDIASKLSKEAFIEKIGDLKVFGSLIYRESGEIMADDFNSYNKINAKEKNVLYPETKNDSFKSDVFKAYLKKVREGSRDRYEMTLALQSIFHIDSSDELDAIAVEYGEKLPESEIRQGVTAAWDEMFKNASDRFSGKELFNAAISRLSNREFVGKLISKITDLGDNRADMTRIAVEFANAKKVEFNKELDALEEADKEQFKKHPDYIDPPANAVSKLRDLGIEVVANFSAVHNRGSYEPFSRWFLNETDKSVNYKSTTLYKNRPLLKNDYKAKYFAGEINGKDGNWWHFPSSRDLNDFAEELRT